MQNNTSLTGFLSALSEILPPDKIRQDEDSKASFGADWTKVYAPNPAAVVFPVTVEQVQAIVKMANQHQVALVPSGGRTGLSGGAVASAGEVVVSFDYMNKILAFNETDRTVSCQAGIVTEQLQAFARENGLFYPVDFASSGSSQIGGNIATNAGGIKVIRYGLTRDQVAGLKVVTGQGDLLELNHGLIKNATGYDLRHLFIGSEGTLGLIVEATLRLTRMPRDLKVLVLGVPDFSALMQTFNHFQKHVDLTAFEFFSELALQKVLAHSQLQRPFPEQAPYYVLLEVELISEAIEALLLEQFEHCVEQGWVLDGVISHSETQLNNLWALRERISESIAPLTPYKNDISVCVSKVPDFLHDIDMIVARDYPGFEIVWFGHIGDGNLHLNILKPADMEKAQFFARCKQVSEKVYQTVAQYGGSISAEHGVGLLKKHALSYSRSSKEIEIMRQMKQVFDPNGILNPGKVFDL